MKINADAPIMRLRYTERVNESSTKKMMTGMNNNGNVLAIERHLRSRTCGFTAVGSMFSFTVLVGSSRSQLRILSSDWFTLRRTRRNQRLGLLAGHVLVECLVDGNHGGSAAGAHTFNFFERVAAV